MLDVTFGELPSLSVGKPLSVALLCGGEGVTASPAFHALDKAAGGALRRAVALKEFKGKSGQSLSLLTPSDALARIVLIGCAPRKGAASALDVENAAAEAAKALAEASEAVLVLSEELASFAPEAALGARLASYRFDLYREVSKDENRLALKALNVAVGTGKWDQDSARRRWTALDAVAQGVFLSRDLVSEPANILYPESFTTRISALRAIGLEVEVLDEAAMSALGFGALLGVAQGSAKRPRTVILRYQGGAEGEAPLAFIGKGVTFDSGGISIKPAAGMDEMKSDMGGAATVVGLMSVLARRKARVNAVGVVGLVENMLSGEAQRPGDVVKSFSGQTIEVLNTDAEGRLVLADLLAYASQRFSPSLMVNLATLTGAIVVALGAEYAGLFSNDDALSAALTEAGSAVGEGVWRMPMGAAYDRQLNSDIADMKNIGGRPGSAILAAQFLKRFVGETAWAHLDIAGTAWKTTSSPLSPKGATGFGVRLLDRFVQDRETRV